MFVMMKFRHIEVIFHNSTITGAKSFFLLYRRLRYIEVCYIEVPL